MLDNNQVIPIVLRNYNNGVIKEPSQKDVLCGKDTTLARHPGNQMFREKIQAELPRYLAARSKQDKMKITKSIVQYITIKQGSRFLKVKNGSGVWIEVDGQAARDKVSHALRFAARQQKKTPNTFGSARATTSAEHSDDTSSQGSSSEEEEMFVPPPPPMPSRQEMERNTTNVEKLFAAFDQPLSDSIDEPVEGPVRRDSAHLLLSFLSTVDFEDEEETTQEDTHLLGSSSFSFDLGFDLGCSSAAELHDHTVTQWAAC